MNNTRNEKRLMLCPWIYKDRWTDFYLQIFAELSHSLHLTPMLDVTADSKLPTDVDFVFLFAIPQWDRPNFLREYIRSLDPAVKIVTYLRDIHNYKSDIRFTEEAHEIFERVNLIISPANQYFHEMYPSFVDKMIFMPDYFGPHDRYSSLSIRQNPQNLCLLSGAVNPHVYPIRAHVLGFGDGNKIVHVPPPYPTSPHNFVGGMYAKLLNGFQCCVTDSGIYNYAVNKVFEIPAAGSLLLTNQTQDMDSCGFVPGIHYVAITKENALERIYDVLDDPERFQGIKELGRDFVLTCHSIDNRIQALTEIISVLLEEPGER